MTSYLCAAFLLALVLYCNAQALIPQCSCSEFYSCRQRILDNLFPCADHCQRHIAALGANYATIRECGAQKASQIEATMHCVEGSYPNACANGAPRMLPKRYKSGMEIALAAEANRMVQANGLQRQMAPLLAIAKKFGRCTQSCINRKTGGCADTSRCSLDLPSDTQVVATIKQCGIRSGLLSVQSVQSLCYCAVNAGLRQLQGACPAIRII